MNKSVTLSLCLVAVIAAACSTAELSQNGGKVEVVNALDRKGCTNLGPVAGKGGGSFGGAYISDEKLIEYATNDIRNNAAERGANVLVMGTHQMGNTSGQYGGTTSTATISGIAYKCPDVAASN
jgi:hypothetical protein